MFYRCWRLIIAQPGITCLALGCMAFACPLMWKQASMLGPISEPLETIVRLPFRQNALFCLIAYALWLASAMLWCMALMFFIRHLVRWSRDWPS